METRKDKALRAARGAGANTKLLLAGLAAVVLLTGGTVAGYGAGQTAPMTGDAQTGPMMGSNPMMGGQGGMGSMMGDGRMQMTGQFDEEEPFDLQFIDQMTAHHRGAIVSSQNMISDSDRLELRRLAGSIQESQSRQIDQMQKWRKQWYPGAEQTLGMMNPTQMNGMMGNGQMREMMGADATDEMFLRMMISHHQMGVDMSERALDEATHPELKELAERIKEEQSAEIELMQGYLEEISGVV